MDVFKLLLGKDTAFRASTWLKQSRLWRLALLQGSDGVWRPANGSLTADGTGLVLTAGQAGAPATATASGWSVWPILLLYSGEGQVAFPWNATI